MSHTSSTQSMLAIRAVVTKNTLHMCVVSPGPGKFNCLSGNYKLQDNSYSSRLSPRSYHRKPPPSIGNPKYNRKPYK